MKEITGKLTSAGLRFGIVVSRFNEIVTEKLLAGALEMLERTGADEEDLFLVRVPGSFEIPWAAKLLAESGDCDGVICLGCLIQGETDHYDYLASSVTGALSRISTNQGLPVAFGIITANNVEQALNRAGLKHGNKGAEAAMAAIEMANLRKVLQQDQESSTGTHE